MRSSRSPTPSSVRRRPGPIWSGTASAPHVVRLLSTQDAPPERIDLLIVRVPKSLALLEDQLHRLAPAVHAGTVVVGTGMVKEIHTSTLKLFEQIIGDTKTSLAVKKARLIFCTPTRRSPRAPAPGRGVTTCPPASGPHRGGPSSTTPGCSVPNASTSAPGSSCRTCRSTRARSGWWTWAAATASSAPPSRWRTRGPKWSSPTSRSRRSRRRRRPSARTSDPTPRPSSASATPSRASRRARSTSY